MDILANEIIHTAKYLLEKQGEFFPIAQVITKEGIPEPIGIWEGEEHPKSQDLIDRFINFLKSRSKNGEITASAISYDIRIKDKAGNRVTDAICAKIENNKGEAIEIHVPYKKGLFGKISYGQAVVCAGENTIFEKP